MDCPIRSFQQSAEEKNTKYLMKNLDLSYEGNFDEAFYNMHVQLIDAFGLGKTGTLLFHNKRAFLMLTLDYIITENERFETDITLIKNRVEKLYDSIESDKDIRQINASNYKYLRKYLEFDPNTLTVYNYHYYLRDYDSETKKAKSKKRSKLRSMA